MLAITVPEWLVPVAGITYLTLLVLGVATAIRLRRKQKKQQATAVLIASLIPAMVVLYFLFS